MRPELSARRRVLRVTFQRYVEADREWRAVLLEAKDWFPRSAVDTCGVIGNPGSRIRKVFDMRIRALEQFEAARLKFVSAKRRLPKRTGTSEPQVFLRP